MSDIPSMMKALVIEADKVLNYKDIPVPELKADEVLVKVRACGICGSDIPRALHNGCHAYPQVVGHEFSGEIAKIGGDVKDIEIGERVTVAPLVPCRHCEECEQGFPAMCTHYSFIGSRQQGAMAEYVAVPARNIVKLGENVTFEQAACIEPTTVAIHGVERAGAIDAGKSAIVFGCGTIGMLTLEVLKAKGLEKVYAIDIDDNKLEMAKKLGAYEAINSKNVDVIEYFNEHGLVDYAFETAGVPFLQAQILDLVKKKGTVVYIGTAHGEVKFPAKTFEKILRGELNVTGSWQSFKSPFPGNDWTGAVELIGSGKIKVDELITHKFKLSDGIKAFETLTDRTSGAIKVMYVMEDAESVKNDDFFSIDIINSSMTAQNSDEAIKKVGEILKNAGYVNEAYIESVLEREKNFPTGMPLMGSAIAIPHATPEGNVLKNGIAVAKMSKPVTFHSMEDPSETVEAELVFLLALKDSGQHLEILRQMFTSFQNPNVIKALKDSKTESEILEIMEKYFGKK